MRKSLRTNVRHAVHAIVMWSVEKHRARNRWRTQVWRRRGIICNIARESLTKKVPFRQRLEEVRCKPGGSHQKEHSNKPGQQVQRDMKIMRPWKLQHLNQWCGFTAQALTPILGFRFMHNMGSYCWEMCFQYSTTLSVSLRFWRTRLWGCLVCVYLWEFCQAYFCSYLSFPLRKDNFSYKSGEVKWIK